MKKPILVGKGFRKVSLERIIRDGLAKNEDVIVFDSLKDESHVYHDGIVISNLSIKLRGETAPEETILETIFEIENSKVILENLTIDATNLAKNALAIRNSNV
ncbi:hypothetical protein, partial [Mycobacterium tuberculosis]